MQGISGVNEKYRIKSSTIKKNNFLAHSTNFIIKTSSKFTDNEITVFLNSKLLNWFFKIFSTNSNVNSYEVDILPIIELSKTNKEKIRKIFNSADEKNYLSFSDTFNEIVNESFQLSKNEIQYIESFF